MASLNGLKVAILVTDGFEQDELTKPRQALDEAGAETKVVSPKDDKVRGWKYTDWAESMSVDQPLSEAKANQFDALLLPGGVINPDKLRMEPKAVEFVKSFFTAGKPVASICHGPWTIISGCGQWPEDCGLAISENGFEECRRRVDRQRSRRGRQARLCAKARRYPGI